MTRDVAAREPLNPAFPPRRKSRVGEEAASARITVASTDGQREERYVPLSRHIQE